MMRPKRVAEFERLDSFLIELMRLGYRRCPERRWINRG
jgi:hypothetical protein